MEANEKLCSPISKNCENDFFEFPISQNDNLSIIESIIEKDAHKSTQNIKIISPTERASFLSNFKSIFQGEMDEQLLQSSFLSCGYSDSNSKIFNPRAHRNQRKLVNRSDFKVNIPKNSYEDILFYEKKALKLNNLSDFINQNAFRIDLQMNLREYLFKISPAQIYDRDLQNNKLPENFSFKFKDRNFGEGFVYDRFQAKILYNEDESHKEPLIPEIRVNLLGASALLEQTMNFLE